MCPQKIHVFLWLCAHNKILTRDNLAKRRDVEDPSCLFCTEPESVQHLLFDCVVARHVWDFLSELFETERIVNFENIFAFWHMHKKKPILNMVIAASLWSLWRLRNNFCFQGQKWKNMNCILAKLSCYLHQWKVLCDDGQATLLQRCIQLLDKRRGELLRITW